MASPCFLSPSSWAASAPVLAASTARQSVGVINQPVYDSQFVGAANTGMSWAGTFGLAFMTATVLRALVRHRHRRPVRQRCATVVNAIDAGTATTTLPEVDRNTTKAFRRDLQRSDAYHKFGKTQMQNAMKELLRISGSDLVMEIRNNGNRLTIGDVTFVLADSYGFCWGVERSVAMAYEARNFFPDKNIWVTNEIIHNPLINENLSKMGMNFVQLRADGSKDFTGIKEGDVVVLPAFGASIDEMAFLKNQKALIVDTTCPWVSKVWNAVEKSKDKGCTSIIHGKYSHEETIATKSFAKTYLIIKDMADAEYVAEYILGRGNRDDFMARFVNAMSKGFDPDQDLQNVGVANQTTMLKGETELIGKLFERVMINKYGPQEINQHFVSFNTICDATQHRQDAMYNMLGAEYEAPTSALYAALAEEQVGVTLKSDKKAKLSSKAVEDTSRGKASPTAPPPLKKKIDMCLVVGGFNSSNTTHLIEIAQEEGVPGYHVDSAMRIGGSSGESNTVTYKPLELPPWQAMLEEGLETKDGFLPDGPIVIGVTSGASTPDSTVGECLQRVLHLKGHKI